MNLGYWHRNYSNQHSCNPFRENLCYHQGQNLDPVRLHRYNRLHPYPQPRDRSYTTGRFLLPIMPGHKSWSDRSTPGICMHCWYCTLQLTHRFDLHSPRHFASCRPVAHLYTSASFLLSDCMWRRWHTIHFPKGVRYLANLCSLDDDLPITAFLEPRGHVSSLLILHCSWFLHCWLFWSMPF